MDALSLLQGAWAVRNQTICFATGTARNGIAGLLFSAVIS
jgi:hypothetical protein